MSIKVVHHALTTAYAVRIRFVCAILLTTFYIRYNPNAFAYHCIRTAWVQSVPAVTRIQRGHAGLSVETAVLTRLQFHIRSEHKAFCRCSPIDRQTSNDRKSIGIPRGYNIIDFPKHSVCASRVLLRLTDVPEIQRT